MSDAEWLIIVSVLVLALYLVLVKDWRLEPEEPPVNQPDSANYKRGC